MQTCQHGLPRSGPAIIKMLSPVQDQPTAEGARSEIKSKSKHSFINYSLLTDSVLFSHDLWLRIEQ